MSNSIIRLILSCLLISGCTSSRKVTVYEGGVVSYPVVEAPPTKEVLIARKYATILSVPPRDINIRLYSFIEDWMATPYKWGGMDKRGIDCSAFIRRLFQDVYGLQLPRTCVEQLLTARVERFTSMAHLAEGDILFFRMVSHKTVSHVGIYLQNNMFINASSRRGVVIYSFDNYWRRHFVTAARLRVPKAGKSLAIGKLL